MTPDINIKISFDSKNKNNAIEALKSFCVNTDKNTFDSNLITEKCNICFLIDEEDSTLWFRNLYEYSRVIDTKLLIGILSLNIYDYSDGTSEFDFWPVFGHGGKVCLDSKVLNNHFIDLLKKINGYNVVIYEDGAYSKTLYELRTLPNTM